MTQFLWSNVQRQLTEFLANTRTIRINQETSQPVDGNSCWQHNANAENEQEIEVCIFRLSHYTRLSR